MDSNPHHFSVIQHLRSPAWDSRKSQPSRALVQVLTDGVRILISLEEDDFIVALDEIQFTRELSPEEQFHQFCRFIPQSVLSESAISSVVVAMVPRHFTFLPEHLYDATQGKLLLESLGPVPYAYSVKEEWHEPGMVLIFEVPQVWLDWAGQVFSGPELVWTTGISGLVRHGIQHPEITGPRMFARIDSRTVLILGMDGNQLLFANSFPYRHENDLLYFLLLAAEELAFSAETTPVFLSGSILTGSVGFEKLSRYFGNLRFTRNPERKVETGQGDWHREAVYFDLLSLNPQTLFS